MQKHRNTARSNTAVRFTRGASCAVAIALFGLASQPVDAAKSQTAKSKTAAPENRVSLNFVNADVESVVRAMGQYLKRDFILDPRVKGTITLATDQPVTKAEAYNLLLTSLRFQGFTIVESGGVYKVLPEADAKFAGGPTQITRGGARTDGIRGDQIVTQIFRLNYESASNMVNMLRPLVTANNPITVNPGNNSIVITDYADNLQRIGRIIAGVDTPPSADGDVVPLQYALAVDVAPLVQRVLEPPQGGTTDPGQRVTVLADSRTNTIILRATSPARISSAKGLIARLDVPTTTAGNIHIVYLKNAEATKLAQTLRSIMSGDTSSLTPASGSSSGTFAQGAQGALSSGGGGGGGGPLGGLPAGSPPGTVQSALGGSNASTLSNPFGSPGASASSNASSGFIQADVGTNALIITAPDPIYRNLRTIIENLDVRRPQVFIEALIVEVTADKAAEFGVQWQDLSGVNNSGTNVIGGTNFGATGTNIIGASLLPSGLASLGQGLNVGIVRGSITIGGVQLLNLGVLARAFESDNNANVLSTPNLLTLDNEEAQIVVAQQIPFVTGSYAQTGTTASVTPFNTIERKDVGLTLKIKPTISDNGTVKLLIYQEVSNVLNSTINSPNGPTTTKRAIQTVIQPNEDELVVLGGLIQDQVENGTSQVPVLGSIPYIGGLFRYQTRSRSRTNLMIFLRPHVIRDQASKGVYAEKYDTMRRVQIEAQAPGSPILPSMPGSVLPPRTETPEGVATPYQSPEQPPMPALKPGSVNTR
ncbi:MAG: type II secretion system secretin GspD [Burkholderiaceae bacterium]